MALIVLINYEYANQNPNRKSTVIKKKKQNKNCTYFKPFMVNKKYRNFFILVTTVHFLIYCSLYSIIS